MFEDRHFQNRKVDLKCAVVRADVSNGNVSFPKGIAVDSDKLTLVSGGTVNLQTTSSN